MLDRGTGPPCRETHAERLGDRDRSGGTFSVRGTLNVPDGAWSTSDPRGQHDLQAGRCPRRADVERQRVTAGGYEQNIKVRGRVTLAHAPSNSPALTRAKPREAR